MISGLIERACAVLLIGVLAGTMAACSTTDSVGITAAPAPQAAAAPAVSAQPADPEALVIGVVSIEEPGNRSGGAADATQKAAMLAAQSFSKGSVVVQTLPERGAQGKALASQFAQAGARIVVGGSDAKVADGLARELAARTVPTISLAPVTDTRLALYSAALSARDEAVALIGEAKRRGYARVALVNGAGADSAGLGNVIAVVASEQGVELHQIDGKDASKFASGIGSIIAGGKLDAVIFAGDPRSAEMLIGGTELGGAAIVGNAGWALAEPLPRALKGAWYPSLPYASLKRFAERYRAAYGETPTLASAVVHDLVIMAAALDQMAGQEAFSASTLQNDLGFTGFTGPFAFGAAGLIRARTYEIVIAE